ncbi:(2Fe-2S)-binding protein [Microbispora sp. SCL1-1]|uniref:(2Fe-2S)-binding protein n=1 Tax=Microbispora TaxID=2005 RepID=UPI0011586318|nr:(2Fe-2S)-binding protein [Microbispora sp. SCL1-1]NJP27818.1 (2Fe-2S)-binding protein [Microbispora sp. CL1-1]TQS10585.1 (2Fe-2S)-binding protein [Microbispora sp. SCL1-1]
MTTGPGERDERILVRLRVNGVEHAVRAEPRESLAELLREKLRLTGTHVGCEQGVCGACTVLLDGASVRSCLLLAVQADGHEVTTVEGLASGASASHPLRRAFTDNHALQCGFCTPGVLMTAYELLSTRRGLSERDIRVALSGNLCRCTGYQGIIAAVRQADEQWERDVPDQQHTDQQRPDRQ